MSYGDVTRDRCSPVRPLLEGDILDGYRVAGFTWKPSGNGSPSSHLDDRLLLDGDEHLPTPPDRPVPQTSEAAVECAPIPPADLDSKRVRPGSSVDPTIPYRVDSLLDLPGAPWQPVARTLFASVHATGHRLWLAGGVVRDVVAGVAEHQVNDLDLAGTVPPGRFTDILYQSLRASRMSEFRPSVNPGTLVCRVTPPRSTNRLIEYRGLSVGGFRFPAVGSRLTEDVSHRDFRFNALFYDALGHELFDPSGYGVADLIGDRRTRRFVPLKQTSDPGAQAEVVLRAMKFGLRWADSAELDLEGLNTWIAGLATDLCRTLTPGQWARLTTKYRECIHAAPADQREFAAKVVQPGRELLETLIGGAR